LEHGIEVASVDKDPVLSWRRIPLQSLSLHSAGAVASGRVRQTNAADRYENVRRQQRATMRPSSMDSVVVGRMRDVGKAIAIAIVKAVKAVSKGNSIWECARHTCEPLGRDEQPD
jgi:uncharacterized YccA/Bax inhibitor family protein